MKYHPYMRFVLAIVLATALLALAGTPLHAEDQGADSALVLPPTELQDDLRVLHALDRLGYGPRPGDPARVRSMGLEAYIQEQLNPTTVPDPDLTRRLSPLTSLSMTMPERLTHFPPRPLVLAVARQLKNQLTPEERAELLPEIEPDEPRESRADKKTAKKSDPRKLSIRKAARKAAPGPRVLSDELAQAKVLRAIYSKRQLEEVMTDFWFNHFNVYSGKGAVRWWVTDYEQTAIRPHALGNFRDMLGAVARHPAMLFYLDNWLSSAPHAGGIDALTMRVHSIDGMRDQGLPPGGLATLLMRHRGLDTTELEQRIARQDARRRMKHKTQKTRKANRGREAPKSTLPGRAGLNENYARELLELHTLGVDGGYSQRDIVEVARAFTGWTLLPLAAGQTFAFVPALHDRSPKTVLGVKLESTADGQAQGEAVLDLLAGHRSTARFIATKLVRRFVSDDPPAALVDRLAQTFSETDGDIRAVLRTLFTSPEFWSPEAYKAKVKTPFEFVVSAARATAAEVRVHPTSGVPTKTEEAMTTSNAMSEPGPEPEQAMQAQSMTDRTMASARPEAPSRRSKASGAKSLLRVLYGMGQPLYGCQPPTGYKDTQETWVSAGALLQRMKTGMGLTLNRVRGVETDVSAPFSERPFDQEALETLAWTMTGRVPEPNTLAAIREQLQMSPEQIEALGLPTRFGRKPQGPARMAAGWILAGAEFQRR